MITNVDSSRTLAVLTLALAGCGVLSVGGKPIGEPSAASGPTAESKGSEEATDSDWDRGRWQSRFGTIKFTAAGDHKFTGEYPGGTLTCEGRRQDLTCAWADNTGSGKAHFHWDADGNATGTFGNGASDTDQGKWDLGWVSTGVALGGGSSGSSGTTRRTITLKNSCGHSVPICIVEGAITKRPDASKASSEILSLDVGARIQARSGSSCSTVIAEISASTDVVEVCR